MSWQCRLPVLAGVALVVFLATAGTHPGAGGAEPNDPSQLNRIGIEHLKSGRLDDAISTLEKALEIKPDFPAALTNLGLALAIQGRIEEAIAAHRKALEYDPNFRQALNNLGNALTAKGELEDAILSYRQALALPAEPTKTAENAWIATEAEIRFNLSLALFKAERRAEAVRELAEAQRLDPKWSSPGLAPGEAAPQRSSPRTARQFAVQVGAFEDPAKAEALAQDLSWRYQRQVGISPITVRGRTLYRVRIRAQTQAEAKALAERLPREQNLPAWIVPVN